ncbi:hypothetical protein SDC9_190576 [bioreactor metagenome]|uniref:CstA N-terminal domain-containing protein n=1 Tax=bioreactor metagenome TaxID=1076179 RepID=A0A645HVK7_9ZZZZ
MFEALFILTTIDAGTRVARYILQDIIGTYLYAPMKRTSWWPGVLITSAIVSYCWGYLLYSGDVATIWPLFGVANQLLSVVALALGTTIILKIAVKKAYAWIAIAPLLFLSATVITAGVMNTQIYFKRGDVLGNTNGTISIVLIILVVVTLIDSVRKWNELWKTDHPIGMNTGDEEFCPVNTTKPNIPS